MARADYGSWSKFNDKIVTKKEQLEIINKVKKADNVNYYADAILSLCDGKYILSYFKGYYFTFHVFNGESYDYISEDSIIKVHTADMNDYKYQNKGVKDPFVYENEDIILKIYYLSSFEKPAKYFMHHLCKYEFIDKHTNDTWISIGGYGYGEGFTTWEGEHDEEGLKIHKEAYEELFNAGKINPEDNEYDDYWLAQLQYDDIPVWHPKEFQLNYRWPKEFGRCNHRTHNRMKALKLSGYMRYRKYRYEFIRKIY